MKEGTAKETIRKKKQKYENQTFNNIIRSIYKDYNPNRKPYKRPIEEKDIHAKSFKDRFYKENFNLETINELRNNLTKAQKENQLIRNKYLTGLAIEQWHQTEKRKELTNEQMNQLLEQNNIEIKIKDYQILN